MNMSALHAIDRSMVLPKAYYFLFYGAGASLVPFLPLYYRSMRLSGNEIGVLLALPPLMALVSAPLWSGLADATQQHKRLLMLAVVMTLASVLTLSMITHFYFLIPVVAAYALFNAPVMPLVDSTVLEMLGERKSQYGRQRLWGAVGWGIAAPVVGWLAERGGLHWNFYSYLALMSTGLLIIAYLPVTKTSIRPRFRQSLRSLLLNWQWVMFLMITLLGGTILSIISGFLFLYLNDMNASSTLMGLALTFATISELPVLYFSEHLLKRWSAKGLLTFSLVITIARCLAYSFIKTPGWVLLIQLLHGTSFAALWVAGVSYANEISPKGMGATAQGMFSGVQFGLAGIIGGLIGGWLYGNMGAVMMFRWVGIIGTTLAILLLLIRNWRHQASEYIRPQV